MHAGPRISIPVRVRSGETISERLEERNDLVFFLICQTKIASRHVEVVFYLGHGPAVNPLDCSLRAVTRGDRVREGRVASVVEMDKLLQALDVAIVEKLLLEVRPWRFSCRTLLRCHRHIARGRHLHLSVDRWGKFSPVS